MDQQEAIVPHDVNLGVQQITEVIKKNESSYNQIQTNRSSQTRNQMNEPKSRKRDCQHFIMRGRCKYGNSCKFNHPGKQMKNLGNKDLSLTNERSGPLFEGLFNGYFPQGSSRSHRGSSTYSTHSSSAISKAHNCNVVPSETSDYSAELPEYHRLPLKHGSKKCKFFLNGNCKFGEYCKFDHSMSGSHVSSLEPTMSSITFPKQFSEQQFSCYQQLDPNYMIPQNFFHHPPYHVPTSTLSQPQYPQQMFPQFYPHLFQFQMYPQRMVPMYQYPPAYYQVYPFQSWAMPPHGYAMSSPPPYFVPLPGQFSPTTSIAAAPTSTSP